MLVAALARRVTQQPSRSFHSLRYSRGASQPVGAIGLIKLKRREIVAKLLHPGRQDGGAGHHLDIPQPVLGQALRRTVRDVDDGEFKVIKTSAARGKSAA
jgi:hypothetical protein